MTSLAWTLLAGFVIFWAWVIAAAVPGRPAKRRPMPPWLLAAGTAPVPEPAELVREPGSGIAPSRDA
jgi:hypothetical protein